MQEVLLSKQINNPLSLIFKISLTIKNLIIILTAVVSFILWFSAALQTPKRLNKVEETLNILINRQNKTEGQISLINQDTKIIKNILLNRSYKNDK